MIEGLMYLHSQNWVHRDIKIENILINFKNEALVSDFTFIRQQRPPILSNTFCGSLQYAAPEILASQKSYDGFKADIWSMGIIIFAIHSGSMPVVNESDPTVIRNELNDIQHRIKHGMGAYQMSPNLKDLLSKILVIDPKGRISLENALKHAWFTEKTGAKRAHSVEQAAGAKVVPLPHVRPSAVFLSPDGQSPVKKKVDSKSLVMSRKTSPSGTLAPKTEAKATPVDSSSKNPTKPVTGAGKSPGKN